MEQVCRRILHYVSIYAFELLGQIFHQVFFRLNARCRGDTDAALLPQAHPQHFCPAAGRAHAMIVQRALPDIVDDGVGIDVYPP